MERTVLAIVNGKVYMERTVLAGVNGKVYMDVLYLKV